MYIDSIFIKLIIKTTTAAAAATALTTTTIKNRYYYYSERVQPLIFFHPVDMIQLANTYQIKYFRATTFCLPQKPPLPSAEGNLERKS